jgi:hypothetical protein
MVGDYHLGPPYALNNRPRQDVAEQRLGALPFGAQLVEQPFFLKGGADARAQQDRIERLGQGGPPPRP